MKKPKHKQMTVSRVKIPTHLIAALSDNERWAYYLMGYIANELNYILKLLVISLKSNESKERFRHMPEIIQSSMLFRLAMGKSHEAMLQLRTGEFRKVFNSVISKHRPSANARWKEVNAAFNSSARWLGKLRNGTIFHYPTLDEWSKIITPDSTWEDDEFYFSKDAWDVYFDASEIVGQSWMLTMIGNGIPPTSKEDAQKKFEDMINTCVRLVGLLRTFVMDCLEVFIADYLLGSNPSVEQLGHVRGTNIDSVTVPTWVFRD